MIVAPVISISSRMSSLGSQKNLWFLAFLTTVGIITAAKQTKRGRLSLPFVATVIIVIIVFNIITIIIVFRISVLVLLVQLRLENAVRIFGRRCNSLIHHHHTGP